MSFPLLFRSFQPIFATLVYLLPGKLTCPPKTNGWKMYFLLKQSFFRGHVSFLGCIDCFPSEHWYFELRLFWKKKSVKFYDISWPHQSLTSSNWTPVKEGQFDLKGFRFNGAKGFLQNFRQFHPAWLRVKDPSSAFFFKRGYVYGAHSLQQLLCGGCIGLFDWEGSPLLSAPKKYKQRNDHENKAVIQNLIQKVLSSFCSSIRNASPLLEMKQKVIQITCFPAEMCPEALFNSSALGAMTEEPLPDAPGRALNRGFPTIWRGGSCSLILRWCAFKASMASAIFILIKRYILL